MSYTFLSHRTSDKPRLRPFILKAIQNRIPLWLDDFEGLNRNLEPQQQRIDRDDLMGSIRKGQEWPKEIESAIINSFAIVLFWSNQWSGDRVWLAKEHGIALAFHRQKLARYFPVFLDAPETLLPGIAKFRVESGDTVQGYNVAVHGERALDELVYDLKAIWSVDWARILRDNNSNAEQIVELLRLLPEGPAVDRFDISFNILRRFSEGTDEVLVRDIIGRSNRLILRALGREVPNEHAFTIRHAAMRPNIVAPETYWDGVFAHACPMGPRAIGALFLTAPRAVTAGAEAEFSQVLTKYQKQSL